MQLKWHDYKYFPYEKELASREAASLLSDSDIFLNDSGLSIDGPVDENTAKRLVYFSQAINGHGIIETNQSRLEQSAGIGKRQATRYSVHGLHEYKGKFNPQVVRAILNIFGVQKGQSVLDPFCGSGTALVECAHVGVVGKGIDINPGAVFIANAKLKALTTSAKLLREDLRRIKNQLQRTKSFQLSQSDDARIEYLLKWFQLDIIEKLEKLRQKIEKTSGDRASILLSIASNMLRDYSFQDPRDLRIRRRKSPLPEKDIFQAYFEEADNFLRKLEAAQDVVGVRHKIGSAIEGDITFVSQRKKFGSFDAAITSPPYATALPYIDTQRLSLVWLNLITPNQILALESDLVGSREIRGVPRSQLCDNMRSNSAQLPEDQARLCLEMERALKSNDGFRRQAIPILLYRYFAAMKRSFESVHQLLKSGAPYALIVGHNHTTLGGKRFDIDTPSHLSNIAESAGWSIVELLPLQTYRRYGLHQNNAVASETLMILEKQ